MAGLESETAQENERKAEPGVDSTGLKIYGEGEWKVRKHGYSKHRTWRKLYVGANPDTGATQTQ